MTKRTHTDPQNETPDERKAAHLEATRWQWDDTEGPRGNLREAVAVFDDEANMQAAVDDLESHGFSNAAISRPPPIDDLIKRRQIKNVSEIEDDPKVPHLAYIDPESRMSGLMVLIVIPAYVLVLIGIGFGAANAMATLPALALALLLGGLGGLGGWLLARRLRARLKSAQETERAMGGFLLWVRTGSHAQEEMALQILRAHKGRHVHMHGPSRA